MRIEGLAKCLRKSFDLRVSLNENARGFIPQALILL